MLFYGRVAARNLLQARRRTLLLSAALGTVSMFMVLFMTFSQGISDTLIRAATLMFTGHVNIAGYYKTRPDNAAMVVTPLTTIRQVIAQHAPQVEAVVDRARGWGKLTSQHGSLESMLLGVDVRDEGKLFRFMQDALEPNMAPRKEQRRLGDIYALSKPHTIVLFAAQAKRLGVDVGDMLTLSVETIGGQQNTDEVEIVAIARDAGFLSNRNVFLNKMTVRDLFQLNDEATGIVMVYLKHFGEEQHMLDVLRQSLSSQGMTVQAYEPTVWRRKIEAAKREDWTGQHLDLTTWRDELGNATWILKTLDALTLLFVTILSLIVIAGIINTMWIAVRERTQEIGMLRAIGMSRRRVLALFMSEAFLLGLGATSVGSLCGAIIATGIGAAEWHVPIEAVQTVLMSDILRLSVRLQHVVETVVLFTTFTGIAALWPALLAARLQPLTAIQNVE